LHSELRRCHNFVHSQCFAEVVLKFVHTLADCLLTVTNGLSSTRIISVGSSPTSANQESAVSTLLVTDILVVFRNGLHWSMEPRRAGLASRRGIESCSLSALCLNLICLTIQPILVIVFLSCVVKFRDLFFFSVWDSGCIKAGARCND
jgi:hypothetical protein